MDLDQTTLINPVLLKLIVMTTTLNEKINGTISDGGISWGCTPTITDLSESDTVKNCHLCKVDLHTLTEKLWHLMLVHLTGDRDKIACINQYTIDYESGFLILLYHLSLPQRLRHDMEKPSASEDHRCWRLYRCFLKPCTKMFSEALYQVAFPYLNNPGIWHSHMPYFLIRYKIKQMGWWKTFGD